MPNTSERSARKRSRGRGQSLVEFALVFPVFILILSGMLDFGFMLYSRMTVINAAREGARVAITATDKTQIPALVHAKVQSVAGGLNLANLTDTSNCVAINSTTSSPCTWTVHSGANLAGVQAGDAVNVVLTYQYKSFFPLLFGTTFNLSSNDQMVIE
jgi:Flp pilus assembly protein TadG